jgi:hypothetical protein
MKPELKQLIEGKRKWTEPLSPEEKQRGFKGWYASKNLPHFDARGAQQFITYRLQDSLPANRPSEWEALLKIEDDLEKRRKIEAYLDRGLGECHLWDPRVADLVQQNLWHHDGVEVPAPCVGAHAQPCPRRDRGLAHSARQNSARLEAIRLKKLIGFSGAGELFGLKTTSIVTFAMRSISPARCATLNIIH